MLQFKEVRLEETHDVSEMTQTMSVLDRQKLNMDEMGLTIPHDTWNNLFLIKTRYNKDDKLWYTAGFVKIYKQICDRYVNIDAIYIKPEYRKNKIAFDTIAAVAYYTFLHLCFNKIESSVNGYNLESFTAQSKYFTLEGTRKRHYYYRGEYHDMHLFALYREEFMEKYFDQMKNSFTIS